jgi:trimethylamine--corrinoid protein Co-methyltransferase
MMSADFSPRMKVLTDDQIQSIIDDSLGILEEIGIAVEHSAAIDLLAGAGAKVDRSRARVFLPRDLCRRSLASVPPRFHLYDREGGGELVVGGDATHFDPGSAALTLYDAETQRIRDPSTVDLVEFAVLTGLIDAYSCQSTAVIPSDVPESLSDRFRLLAALVYCRKPVITGTFTRDGFDVMHAMLCAVRGGKDALAERPLAVFDCCPTAPLSWSLLTCDALISCARNRVPAEIVSMPLTGATSPVTLAGAIIQHTAETLSGVVIHQLAGEGSPLVYGGAPSCFDMRKATTPMGSVETMLIDASYAQVGRALGLPIHAYMGLSDAKLIDYQAGFETAMGVVIAALSGVNIVSGPGMLNFVGTQSLEKLLLDGEICAMAQRLRRGVDFGDSSEAVRVLRDHANDKAFLTDTHTRRRFREEVYYPSEVVDRGPESEWEAAGRPDAARRARQKARRLLDEAVIDAPEPGLIDELESIAREDARAHGVDHLPNWRFLLP